MDVKKRNDIIMIAVLLIAAALLLLFRGGAQKKDSAEIVITRDDEVIFREQSADLVLPYTLRVEGIHGGHNIFIIDEDEDGTVGIRCQEADCPDKICVNTGRVTLPDQPVVCLPHRISARIVEMN